MRRDPVRFCLLLDVQRNVPLINNAGFISCLPRRGRYFSARIPSLLPNCSLAHAIKTSAKHGEKALFHQDCDRRSRLDLFFLFFRFCLTSTPTEVLSRPGAMHACSLIRELKQRSRFQHSSHHRPMQKCADSISHQQ